MTDNGPSTGSSPTSVPRSRSSGGSRTRKPSRKLEQRTHLIARLQNQLPYTVRDPLDTHPPSPHRTEVTRRSRHLRAT